MKTFRVVLTVGGVIFVEADHFESVDGFVRFYRNGEIIAEYAASLVKEDIREKTITQKVPIYFPSTESNNRG